MHQNSLERLDLRELLTRSNFHAHYSIDLLQPYRSREKRAMYHQRGFCSKQTQVLNDKSVRMSRCWSSKRASIFAVFLTWYEMEVQ